MMFGIFLISCEKGAAGDWEKIRKDIRSTFPAVQQLSTAELQQWLNAQGTVKPLLIDRREEDEYAVSHLHGALFAAGEEEALKIIEKEGKNRPIVIYCSVGYRSSILAEKLAEKGHANIYNLEGSIFKWANEGRPIYRGEEQVHKVHPFNSRWGDFLDRKLWYTLDKKG